MNKYIVAVSGGVDSVVLLHKLAQEKDNHLFVVHINHGIRDSSETDKDVRLVKELCTQLNIGLEVIKLDLGPKASEDEARQARRDVLIEQLRSRDYNKIATAHHQDDVVETMVINLLRGTGRKGLSSLKNDELYIRPLISLSKQDIISYALKHNLNWNEDSTNQDQTILRNYIRLTLLPKIYQKLPTFKQQFIDLYYGMINLNKRIDVELATLDKALAANENEYNKQQFIMLPIEVSYSWLHHILTVRYRQEVDAKLLKRVRTFIHTAKNNKTLKLSKSLEITSQSKTFTFTHST